MPFSDCTIINPMIFDFLRHLEQYEQSTTSLMTALNERSCLEEKEVENTLKELSATVSDSEEYIQNRLEVALFLSSPYIGRA